MAHTRPPHLSELERSATELGLGPLCRSCPLPTNTTKRQHVWLCPPCCYPRKERPDLAASQLISAS
eukprot:289652-Chlamydomonas_euryale.AAC.3